MTNIVVANMLLFASLEEIGQFHISCNKSVTELGMFLG